MTKLESLKSRLLAAESRHDLREAQRIFTEIQRETWRAIPRAADRHLGQRSSAVHYAAP